MFEEMVSVQKRTFFSKMAEEEQKLQNSAHRSHWKHLLYVADISQGFMEQFKHAKVGLQPSR